MLVSARFPGAGARGCPALPDGAQTELERLGDLADPRRLCRDIVRASVARAGDRQEFPYQAHWATARGHERAGETSPLERGRTVGDQAVQCAAEGPLRGD